MNKTKIPWCDWTWNPIVGCSPASEGCANCYAAAISKRFHLPWGSAHFLPERLDQPAKVRKPGRVFVCSMGDLFHESVPDDWIKQVFNAMHPDILQPSCHTFQILTKRPQRMAEFFKRHTKAGGPIAWSNVWLGVTVENQARADERVPILLGIPSAVRFVSVEPMLGPVDLASAAGVTYWDDPVAGIHWVIAGPETGPKARPCQDAWINALAAESPCFFDKRNPRREWPRGKTPC
jgi:protein gp37